MRRRSGALHSTNPEEFLRLAEEQQQQQQSMAQNSNATSPHYELRNEINLQGNNTMEEKAQMGTCEFEENKRINSIAYNIMLIGEFGTPSMDKIYQLDAISHQSSSKYSHSETSRQQLLDLVIVKEETGVSTVSQSSEEEYEKNVSQTVWKLWLQDSLKSRQTDPKHNLSLSIIQKTHYHRSNAFIFMYKEGDCKSEENIHRCYEQASRVMQQNIHAHFIGILPEEDSMHKQSPQKQSNSGRSTRSSEHSSRSYHTTSIENLPYALNQILKGIKQQKGKCIREETRAYRARTRQLDISELELPIATQEAQAKTVATDVDLKRCSVREFKCDEINSVNEPQILAELVELKNLPILTQIKSTPLDRQFESSAITTTTNTTLTPPLSTAIDRRNQRSNRTIPMQFNNNNSNKFKKSSLHTAIKFKLSKSQEFPDDHKNKNNNENDDDDDLPTIVLLPRSMSLQLVDDSEEDCSAQQSTYQSKLHLNIHNNKLPSSQIMHEVVSIQ